MIERFGDPENGAFFTTSSDHEELIVRRKDLDDHPAPSGNSAAARGLLRLAALSGEVAYEEQALGVLRLLAEPARSHPEALAYLLGAIDFHLSPTREVALIAPEGDPDAIGELVAVARGALPAPRRRWPPARRARPSRRCSPTARRSTAVPPPTSASASPARRRSARRTSSSGSSPSRLASCGSSAASRTCPVPHARAASTRAGSGRPCAVAGGRCPSRPGGSRGS